MMKKLALIFAISLLISSIALGTEKNPEVRVMALAGNSGLAMVSLMEKAAAQTRIFKYSVLKSPDLLMAKLVAGEADIAALPVNQAAILYNKGINVQIPAIIGWGVMYIVGNDTGIKSWKDLKGKEIYLVAKGAVPDLLFRYLAVKNGLNPERDLKLNYIASPVELAQLAAAGRASLATLPEPWVTQVLLRSPQSKVILDFQTEWSRVEKQRTTYPQTCLVVTKKFAREQPARFKQFLKDLENSIDWLNSNPEAGGILAEKYVQIPAAAVEKGIVRCNLSYKPARKVKEEVGRFLERLGEVAPGAIGGKVPDAGFYYQP
jgi:NitT/TauT family transport system substrate-binding protein